MSQVKELNEVKRATSRREFLRRAAKGSSVAALISCGLLDDEISRLIAAWAPQQTLSREAIEGPLPTKNLVVLRDLLKGEYYLGGRFYRFSKEGLGYVWGRAGCDPEVTEGKCPEVKSCARYCNGEVNCPEDGSGSGEGCGGQGCPSYNCDGETCPNGLGCDSHACMGGELCGNQVSTCTGVYVIIGKGVDSRMLPAFSFEDIARHADTAFVQELLKALNLRSASSLEKEVASMIFKRQTLSMRGVNY